jgi:hypothetical protein
VSFSAQILSLLRFEVLAPKGADEPAGMRRQFTLRAELALTQPASEAATQARASAFTCRLGTGALYSRKTPEMQAQFMVRFMAPALDDLMRLVAAIHTAPVKSFQRVPMTSMSQDKAVGSLKGPTGKTVSALVKIHQA